MSTGILPVDAPHTSQTPAGCQPPPDARHPSVAAPERPCIWCHDRGEFLLALLFGGQAGIELVVTLAASSSLLDLPIEDQASELSRR